MNTKIEKGLKYLAAAIFLLALAVNVKVTLDDPFVMMSDLVIAETTTTSSSSSSSGGTLANLCCPIWTITVETGGMWPKVICTTGGEYKCEDCDCPN